MTPDRERIIRNALAAYVRDQLAADHYRRSAAASRELLVSTLRDSRRAEPAAEWPADLAAVLAFDRVEPIE